LWVGALKSVAMISGTADHLLRSDPRMIAVRYSYPVVVFGGKHADVPIIAEMGAALGRLIASEALACVIDLSELGSNAARRRFMAAFAEALYEGEVEDTCKKWSQGHRGQNPTL
jgi:hypothetical protein